MTTDSPTLGIVTCSRSDLVGLYRTLTSLIHDSEIFHQLVLVLSDYSESDLHTLKESFPKLSFDLLIVEPTGIYSAMNQGLEKLTTELVLFLNGGDELINPRCLVELKNQMGKSSWGYGALEITAENTTRLRKYSFNRYSKNLHRFAIKYVPHPSCIFSVSQFKLNGGYNLKFKTGADQDLILKFARDSYPITSKGCISRFYLGGQSSRNNFETISELHEISRSNFGKLLGSEILDQLVWLVILKSRSTVKGLQRLLH